MAVLHLWLDQRKIEKIICEDQNPLKSEILYYTEYGVNPDPYKLFEIFVSYYNKIIKVL